MTAVRDYVRRHPMRVSLVAVALLGLIARLAWIAIDSNYKPIVDASIYYHEGLFLYTHHRLPRLSPPGVVVPIKQLWPSAYWPPLYAMFQATGQLIHHWFAFTGLSAVTVIRIMQAFTGAIGVGLMALIALRLFGRRVSVLTGVFAAVFPSSVFVCESLYSESLWVPLFIAAVAALVEFRRTRQLRWAVIGGLLTGLGTMTHSNGVYLLVPGVIALWPRGGLRLRERHLQPRLFKPLAGFLVLFALVLTPWTIRNWIELDHFIPISTSFGNTIAGTYNNHSRLSKNNPGAWVLVRELSYYASINAEHHHNPNPAVADQQLTFRAFDYIGAHPTYPFVVAYWNTLRLLQVLGPGLSEWYSREVGIDKNWSDLSMFSFWLLAIAAFAGCFTKLVRRHDRWVWLVPGVMYLGIIFIQSEVPRFRSPIDPFLCMLAACACVALWERAESRRVKGFSSSPGGREREQLQTLSA